MWRRLRHRTVFGILVAVLAACFPAVAQISQIQKLGPALDLTERQFLENPRAPTRPDFRPSAVSGFTVDTADRMEVLSFYHCVYLASEGWEDRMDWANGDVSACLPGTVSEAFHADTLRRINYYRAMAGLNTDIQFVADKNEACQAAALMMARNDNLTHNPPEDWQCRTTNGCRAASSSLMLLGTGWIVGPRAVDAFIEDPEDPGDKNQAVSHRRWLLFSLSAEMGNGGLPALGTNKVAAAIWVYGNFNPTAAVDFIAWPPPGHVPYPLVYKRWSFGLPNAPTSAFDSATVTMTQGGQAISNTIIHRGGNYGDSSIVWEPAGHLGDAPPQDLVCTVSISNVVQGTTTSCWTYTVRVMDPEDLGVALEINGPTNPVIGIRNSYQFTPVPLAVSYWLRIRQAVATNVSEDAEAAQIVDGTSPSYSLIQSDVTESNGSSFHLAFPGAPENYADQGFIMDRTLVPTTHTALQFSFLRRNSSTNNRFRVQISIDDEVTWTDLWVTNGVCGSTCSNVNWDTKLPWHRPSISLGAYSNQPCRLRFHFEANEFAYFGTDSDYGVFIDNISVTDVLEVVAETTQSLASAATGFVLQPEDSKRHFLDVAPVLPCVTFPYRPVFLADPVVGSNPVVQISGFNLTSTNTSIGISIQSAPVLSNWLERLTGELSTYNWIPVSDAIFDPEQLQFVVPNASTSPVFYRIQYMPQTN